MKNLIYTFLALIFLPLAAISQCGNGPTSLDEIDVTIGNITGTTADVVATANTTITETVGLFGSLWVRTLSGTTVTLSGAGATGLNFVASYPSETIGEPAGHLYHQFSSASTIDPSALYPLNTPVTVGTLTITPASNIGSSEIVMTDLLPPFDNGGTYLYYRTAVQICNGNGFEDNLIDQTSNLILPIKVSSFDAYVINDYSGKLEWETETEINGSHFEIYRSTDTKNWEELGTVKAVGESLIPQQYSFVDNNVGMLRNSDTYYYQLKMVDLDGTYEMSEIRSITFDFEGIEVSTYPNPTRDRLFVNIISDENYIGSTAEVQIFDNSGKIMQKNSVTLNGITDISVENVPTGIYVVKINVDNNVFTRKLIKVD